MILFFFSFIIFLLLLFNQYSLLPPSLNTPSDLRKKDGLFTQINLSSGGGRPSHGLVHGDIQTESATVKLREQKKAIFPQAHAAIPWTYIPHLISL